MTHERTFPQVDVPTLLDPAKAQRFTVIRSQLPTLDRGRYVDDMTAVQIAISRILDVAELLVLNRQKLMNEGVRLVQPCTVDRLFFDLPTPNDVIESLVPSVIIAPEQDTEIGPMGDISGQPIDEETVDKYGAGTVLQTVGDATTKMVVLALLGTKDDRAAMRKALIDVLIGEPKLSRWGREVTVPEYYDQVVRLDPTHIGYPDTDEDARANRWPIQMRLESTVPLVRLVPTPPALRPVVGVNVVGPAECV